jgi:two-component system NarL family sensor kinase
VTEPATGGASLSDGMRIALAGLRVLLLPVLLAGKLLLDADAAYGAAFAAIFAAYAAWASGVLAVRLGAVAGRWRFPTLIWRAEPYVDLLAVSALAYTSGGPFSETAMAFFVMPVLPAIRMRPQLTARWTLGAVLAYVTLCLLHPTAGESEATAHTVSQVAYLAWTGAGMVAVSWLLARRDVALRRLADEREQLVSEALSAEQRERRRLADRLHDDAVQTLAVARQELVDFRRSGRDASFARGLDAVADASAQIRGHIFDLHPYVLDHAGLAAALRALGERTAQRMGAEVTVAVDPGASGMQDDVLVVVARELLHNAVKHSAASHVVLTVAADVEHVELEVRDDGVGFAADRRHDALAAGHIGLASTEQRLRALSGRLEVTSAAGAGTRVRAILPLATPCRGSVASR